LNYFSKKLPNLSDHFRPDLCCNLIATPRKRTGADRMLAATEAPPGTLSSSSGRDHVRYCSVRSPADAGTRTNRHRIDRTFRAFGRHRRLRCSCRSPDEHRTTADVYC